MKKSFFCTKAELLNFKITLPLAKLDMVGSKLVSNGFFSNDGPVGIQLVTFLLFNFSELSIGTRN